MSEKGSDHQIPLTNSELHSLRVGVFDMGGTGWTGGITYLRNLGEAVKRTIPEELSLFLVRAASVGQAGPDWVSNYFHGVIEVKPFASDRQPVREFVRKGISILLGGDLLNARRFERTLISRGVEVLFGNGLTNRFLLPSVGWFPDFQHVELPEFFTQSEILSRNLQVRRMVKNCTLMVFSSQHAKKQFLRLYPDQVEKARVLNFVAHLPSDVLACDPAYLMGKLNIPEKFIYLPNQFWRHKNHITAFRAVKILQNRNRPVTLVCSGNPKDPRHPRYQEELLSFIQDNKLAKRIFLLGMVDFADVYALIRQSCCVLNPSLYEGWSTTVEETKTIGKPMILSDLEVHREQNPPSTAYFEPQNAEMLADLMMNAWDSYSSGPTKNLEELAKQNYASRSLQFARTFAEICKDAVTKKLHLTA